MQGEIIVYCWNRDLEFWTDDFSVGHVAAAIVHPGTPFELVLSQYPKSSGLVGPNTFLNSGDTIKREIMRNLRPSGLPENAYRIPVKDVDRFSKAAMTERAKSQWCADPTTTPKDQTNCVHSVDRSLDAGGASGFGKDTGFMDPTGLQRYLASLANSPKSGITMEDPSTFTTCV